MSPIPAEYSSKALGIDVASLNGVTQDSRAVEAGYLFAALKGEQADGRNYISSAIKNGASVILMGQPPDNTNMELKELEGAKIVVSDNPRKAFAHITADFYGDQPDHMIAVTGTNGKSSVVHFIDQMQKALGMNSNYIGTLSGSMTTPDPVSLHKILSEIKKAGVNNIAMEASSHGLDQYRMDGVSLSVAAFTNLSQDHLDYHKNMDDYLAAKSRLFSDILPINGVAVLNADSIAYPKLRDICKKRGIKTLSYGDAGEDIRLISCDIMPAGQEIEIEINGETYKTHLPLVGRFQVMNILCALGCVLSIYPEKLREILAHTPNIEGVPGRLQHVSDGARHAYIDYAHTPDALENVLNALRPHTKGKLICVFGCGGDRDKTKRPLMGEIANRLSDIAIITDDNPRSENSDDIRSDIMAGIKTADAQIINMPHRREAIRKGVEILTENDVLLVAGKGHEQGQIFNGTTEPFDDVRETLGAMLGDKVKL